MKTIKETTNGRVFICGKCDAIHIEYKNLNFNLTVKQFKEYSIYLNDLDGLEWEKINKDSNFKRKIIIPTQDKSFNMILNNVELTELKILFGCNPTTKKKNLDYQKLIRFTCEN